MLRVGAVLDGKYRIERYLSSGGFGNTYVAINEFGEQVAVKEFFLRGINQREANNTTVSVSNTENRAQFDQQRAKFKKEAMRLRGLLSPHIVKVQAFFEQNGTSYYVMDYIDGESLAERLRRTGQPLTEAEVLDILNQVLEALDEVHNSQPPLYHLDLKPGNIMADRNGQVLLIDFGSSKQSDGHGGVTVTAATFTREYAPLELIEGRLDKIGPWTDFYALGATIYRLLTNQTPPLYSDIQDEPAAAFHWPAAISQPMRDLTQWMMTPNRTHRPQSVAEVRTRLASFPSAGATEPSSHSKLEGVGGGMSQGLVGEPSSPPKLGGAGGGMSATDETNVASQPASVDPATRIQTRHPINADKLYQWATDRKQDGKYYVIERLGDSFYRAEDLCGLTLYEEDKIRLSYSQNWQPLGILINNYTRVDTAPTPPPIPDEEGDGRNDGGNDGQGYGVYGGSNYSQGYGGNDGGSDGGYEPTSADDSSGSNSFIAWLIGTIVAGLIIVIAAKGCEGPADQVDSYATEADTAAFASVVTSDGNKLPLNYSILTDSTATDNIYSFYIGGVSLEGFYEIEYANKTYRGLFKGGLFNGTGSFEDKSMGYRYEGDWKNGKMNGIGTEYFDKVTQNDALVKYEGEFKNGNREGYGTAYYNDYTTQTGTWKNNELVKITEESTWNYKYNN